MTFTVAKFSPGAGYAMNAGPFLTGDINGDGKTDLVHIVTGSNYANIWLSKGDGTFTLAKFSPGAGYGMNAGPFLTGDINGDGKTDLVHIVTGSDYANIWLSKGDGTFTVPNFSPGGGYGMNAGPFLTGDINGDGKTDLVHIVTGSNYANIWLSKGDGTFTLAKFSPGAGYGMNAGPFLTGDINGDGKTDLVHIVTGSNYANIWLSKGDGTFTLAKFSPGAGYGMNAGPFLTGDINGDGKTDLVHIVTGSAYANIWLSKGDGTFTVVTFSPWAGYGMNAGPFLTGDINGDGKTDLVHIVTGSNYANIWLSKGDGTFTVPNFSPGAGYAMNAGPFLTGDINGDGKTDLVHIVTGSNYANIWLSQFDNPTPTPPTNTTNNYCLKLKTLSLGSVGDLDRKNEEIELEITSLNKQLDCGIFLFDTVKNVKDKNININIPCSKGGFVDIRFIERDICNDDITLKKLECEVTGISVQLNIQITPDNTATSYTQCISSTKEKQACGDVKLGIVGGSFYSAYTLGKEECGTTQVSETASEYILVYEVVNQGCDFGATNLQSNERCYSDHYYPGPACNTQPASGDATTLDYSTALIAFAALTLLFD